MRNMYTKATITYCVEKEEYTTKPTLESEPLAGRFCKAVVEGTLEQVKRKWIV